MRKPTVIAIIGGIVSLTTQAASFLDEFNGTQIDQTKWQTRTPFSDSRVSVANGFLTIENRGTIISKDGIKPPYEVSGKFRFTGTIHDNFKVVIRTSGKSSNNPQEFDDGIGFQVVKTDDSGTRRDAFTLLLNLTNTANVLVDKTHSFDFNSSHTFKIVDDGKIVAYYFDDMNEPLMAASVSIFGGDKIGLYNREGSGNGSFISAGSKVSIDNLQVTELPNSTLLAGRLSRLRGYQFTLVGESNVLYTIERSSNLIHWSSLITVRSPGVPVTFFDRQAPNIGEISFYRAKAESP